MATGQLVRIQLAGLGVNRRTRYSKEMMVSGLGLKAVKPREEDFGVLGPGSDCRKCKQSFRLQDTA